SQARVQNFTADFLDEWASNCLLRDIFEAANAIEYRDEPHRRKKILGIWRLLPKGAFVDDARGTHWPSIGGEFGRGIAQGENKLAYDTLRSRSRKSRTS